LESSTDPASDLLVQLSKVAHALLTDKYVPTEDNRKGTVNSTNASNEELTEDVDLLEKYVIAPRMLKNVVGKGNADFSSNRQQDAFEYFGYLWDLIQRVERVQLPKILPSFTGKVFWILI
jgi:ubiquitin carboxyl-terminal hydrolase 5/13